MATAPTIDERTAAMIRSAIAAAQAGRLEEACAIGERGIAAGGDPVALNAMIGSFLCQLGEYGRSVPHLRLAHSERSADPIITRNLVTALVGAQRYDEAIAELPEDVVNRDTDGKLRRLRAFAAQMSGDLELATRDLETVVAVSPSDWESWNNLGNAKTDAGDLEGGILALQRASALNPKAADTRFNLAQALRNTGRTVEAANTLNLLAADFPEDPRPLGYLFGILQEQGWDAEAVDALTRALERDPNDVGMLIALGRQHLLSFEFAAARSAFRKVLSLEPANGNAFLGIADVLEHESPEELPHLLAEAEKAGIDATYASFVDAMVAQRAKRFADGIAVLRDVPAEFDPVRRWHLVGQLHDGAGDYDLAFQAFSRANEIQAQEPTDPLRRAAALRARLREQLDQTTASWRERWVTEPIEAERPPPVFLVGFPRSGTTLLDTMLMGHPDVEVMEERPILARLRAESGGFDALADMDEQEVRRLQQRYFELAAAHAKLREGSVLIDKSPLHMQNLPFIYRLFPSARFILALRHPADVVLSCFMAKFRLNDSMANFVRLDTAAEFYDLSFSMWQVAQALFPVEIQTVVYEEMIRDPVGVLRPVVENLNLQWSGSIVDHERTAKERGVITTASYAQVTQPIYHTSAGRWQRYRKHLEPILPVLEPWIRKFGYEL